MNKGVCHKQLVARGEKIPELRSNVWVGDKGWKLEFIHNHVLMLHRTLHF